jgi:hypothetical protein
MTEPDLAFIARQLERVLLELRHVRNEMRLVRGQVQIQLDVLERLRLKTERSEDKRNG